MALWAAACKCRLLALALAGGAALVLLAGPPAASAASLASEFAATLSAAEAEEFRAYRAARSAYSRALDAYWDRIEDRKALRKAKKAMGQALAATDYVGTFPPEYEGPKLSPGVAQAWERFKAEREAAAPPKPREIPSVADYLAAAKDVYGFEPDRIPEREFKRRYAEEALGLGLTKDQVVRIYALETGGHGTADMQAGISPTTGKGKPISSALGYAQLLDANSVGEIAKSGDRFIQRLKRMAASGNVSPERAERLRQKAAILRKMVANARSVPHVWQRHIAYAKTPAGRGIHAVNLDGDIGPWLQAIKLQGLRDHAFKAGKGHLAGAEIELMNLAGPATGLEMMDGPARKAPTSNFFSRRGYYVNRMVIGLTAEGLLAELQRRMDISINNPGAVEFADAFDSIRETLPWR